MAGRAIAGGETSSSPAAGIIPVKSSLGTASGRVGGAFLPTGDLGLGGGGGLTHGGGVFVGGGPWLPEG